MSLKVNKISVKQMGGPSMIPQGPGMQQQMQQPQVDPAIQQIGQFFSEGVEQGQKPEEIVFSLMQQEVDQETIGQALMLVGYEQDDIVTLFEQVNLLANAKPANAGQVNRNPQELARNQELAQQQEQRPVQTETIETEQETMMAKSGIEIKPENKGKFTRWAKARGMAVQEAARKVLANKDRYPASVVKMANFARNAAKFKKEEGGETEEFTPHMMYKGRKAVKAKTYEDHLRLKEDGYVHKDELKKAQEAGEDVQGDTLRPFVGPLPEKKDKVKVTDEMVSDATVTDVEVKKDGNSGDPTTTTTTTVSDSTTPDWIKNMIASGSNNKGDQNMQMMQQFLNSTNLKTNFTGDDGVQVGIDGKPVDPNVINKNDDTISGNASSLPYYVSPNMFSQGNNFSLGNAFNSLSRVGRNLFSSKDLDGDGLKDGVLKDWNNKAIANKIQKYADADYTLNADFSKENIDQAGVALKKYLFENPTADDQYDAVGNIVNKGLEDNNIPISTDDIDQTTAEKFKDFLNKNTEDLSQGAIDMYEALRKKLGFEEGGEYNLKKMQFAGDDFGYGAPTEFDPYDPDFDMGEYLQGFSQTNFMDFPTSPGNAKNTNTETEEIEIKPLDPSIDADGDGIPDTIDIDMGDGTGVGGSFQNAFDKINKPTIDADFGGVEGALKRGYNSNLVKGFEGISGGIIDLTSNIAIPFLKDKQNQQKEIDFRNQFNADNLYATESGENTRGKDNINTGLDGSEADRTTGLYLTQGRSAKMGGTNNEGFKALPPEAQHNILSNMAYGGAKGAEAYLANRDRVIKREMSKAQKGGGAIEVQKLSEDGKNIITEKNGMTILTDNPYDNQDIKSQLDLLKTDAALMSAKQIAYLQMLLEKERMESNTPTNIQLFSNDSTNINRPVTDGLMGRQTFTKPQMKTGGETINVDAAMLAKLMAAGADIEIL